MSDPADRNETMPEWLEGVHKLAQDLRGALKVMSEALDSLTSASSQTPTAIGSPSMSGSRSEPKLFEMEGNRASLSSVPSVGSSSTSPKAKRTEGAEKWREGEMVIYFTTYGTEEQKHKTAEAMLRNLSVKGYGLIQVTLDDEVIFEGMG